MRYDMTLRRWSILIAAGLVACGDDDASSVTDAGTADAGSSCTWEGGDAEALPDPPRHTPRWAFEPWISKDISDRDDTFAFVDGFRERDIPVGVVVLDSPWETNYNTFVPHPERYPDFGDMVAQLHAMDVRIVLWTTQMVNRTSFDVETGGHVYDRPAENWQEGRACGFFVDDGRAHGWWKGEGAGVDFFDPRAVAWWRAQQDTVLDLGIDGWKLDFGESYMREDTVLTERGPVPHQEYSEAYYRDFLVYGAHARGLDDFVTMVRPWDQSYDHAGRFYARPEHAPVGWVGDNHRDWTGVIDVLDHLFRSAEAGYVVIGSDIGGYLDRRELDLLELIPFDLEVFQRWTALGALTPFMQLHGRANLTPWTVEGTEAEVTETVRIYRYWSKLHSDLVPFFYALAEEAYAERTEPTLRPVPAGEAAWANDWRFMVGDAFLVAPFYEAGGTRDVELPAGASWYDWWAADGDPIAGGTTLTEYAGASEAGRIPLFVREGAIVPMHVRDDATGIGTAAQATAQTWLVWPSATETAFTTHDEDGMTTTLTASASEVSVSRIVGEAYVRVWLGTQPTSITSGGIELTRAADRATLDGSTEAWWWEAGTRSAWLKLPASATPRTITLP